MAVIPDPGWVPDVTPRTIIESDWGNAIRDRVVHRFATGAERDAAWPDPPPGARCSVGDSAFISVADRWSRVAAVAAGNISFNNDANLPAPGDVVGQPFNVGATPDAFYLRSGAVHVRDGGLYQAHLEATTRGSSAGGYIGLALHRVNAAGVSIGTGQQSILDAAGGFWNSGAVSAVFSLAADDGIRFVASAGVHNVVSIEGARARFRLVKVHPSAALAALTA